MYSSGHTTAERGGGEGGVCFRIWGTLVQCVHKLPGVVETFFV